ncbi:DHA2 family efflux MFS transporter permease subunit [Streptomyces sp. NPDC056144]|uniref:DHA2 family efflux MFS transporter permease subunit n=1 Tax=unclassified Streptomyces TaxID=2593676 RepID=UPI0035D8C72F
MSESAAAADEGLDPRRWKALGVLALGLSMIVLDGTIVSVSLPVIIDDLGLDFTSAQWVNSVYSVVFAALLLPSGKLGDRIGRRRTFAAGIVVFALGSLVAAVASSSGALIWGRVVQGVGGALILPATLSAVNALFRGRERTVAFAVWGSVIAGMAAVGPLLGGWLTTSFTWPWIFIVNLPVAALVLVGAVVWVPETRAPRVAGSDGFDLAGVGLSALGFALVVFALIEGQSYGWWTPLRDTSLPISPIPVLLALGLVLLGVFWWYEARQARTGGAALLDVSLFGSRGFRWGNLTALVVALGEFGLLFVLPLYLVNVLGLSTLGAGVVLALMAVGAFLAGGLTEGLARTMAPARIVTLGVTMEAVFVALTALTVTADTAPWLLALLLAGYGLGLGFASAQLAGAVLAHVRVEQSGQGSAVQSTARQLGSALGAALIGGLLSVLLAHTLPQKVESVPGVPETVANQVVDATRQSAGSDIDTLREQGESGPLGAGGPAVVDALDDGFAQATRWTMFAAAAFLGLGALASTRIPVTLPARARREETVS